MPPKAQPATNKKSVEQKSPTQNEVPQAVQQTQQNQTGVEKVKENQNTSQQKTVGNNQASPTKSEGQKNDDNQTGQMTEKKHRFRPFSYYLPWLLGVLVGTWITQNLLIFILSDSVKDSVTEFAVAELQKADEERSIQSLVKYQLDIEELSASFPKETGIIDFIDQIKGISNQFEASELVISDNQPVQTPGLLAPFVPVTISSSATPSAFTPLMNRLSSGSFLFQPALLEINAINGLDNLSQINYRGNLYVSTELIK